MLDRLLLPELRLAISERDWETLAIFGGTLHPRVVAEMLAQLDDPKAVAVVFSHWGAELTTPVFEYLPVEMQDLVAGSLAKTDLARILERMSHDERADLAKRMSPERLEVILPLVAQVEREDIRRLASFPEGTAGALMTTDYAALPANLTIGEALNRLRSVAPNRETIYYIYVLDGERRLIGFISLKDLILAQPFRTVEQIMRTDVLYVLAATKVEEAANLLAEYDLLALPVVDAEHRLIGIITHDDAMDVMQEEATEDIHRLGAVSPLVESYLETPLLTLWRSRAQWLSLLFVAELATFTALASYADSINKVAVLAMLVPLCISTGGNSGSQAATLITRAMALGQIAPREWRRVLRHELLLGLALGLTLGVIGFLRGALTPESIRGPEVDALRLGLVVGQAVAAICLWGTVIGAMLPLLFRRLGWDPAFASSPFVATFVDVTGIVIFFSIAQLYLHDALAG